MGEYPVCHRNLEDIHPMLDGSGLRDSVFIIAGETIDVPEKVFPLIHWTFDIYFYNGTGVMGYGWEM